MRRTNSLNTWLSKLFSRKDRRRHRRADLGRVEALETRTLLATITWTGLADDGLWENGTNWNLGRSPQSGDDVVIADIARTTQIAYTASSTTSLNSLITGEALRITNGTLGVFETSRSDAALSLEGGSLIVSGEFTSNGSLTIGNENSTLSGNGSLLVNGGMTWSAGTLGGNVTVNVPVGKTLEILGPLGTTALFFNGATISNSGTIHWNGAAISNAGGGAINNLAGGLFDAQNSGTITTFGGGAPTLTINNAGTLRRSSGTGTTTLGSGIAFVNSGVVDIPAGLLNLANGATINNGSSFTGAGETQVNGTASAINGNVTSSNLVLGTGTVSGSATWHGTVIWDGSVLAGTWTVASDGNLNLSRGNSKGFAGGTLNVSGTATWSGTGNIDNQTGGTIQILAGGIFDIQNNRGFVIPFPFNQSPEDFSINNAGTLRRSGLPDETTTLGAGGLVVLTNSGVIDNLRGTLHLGHRTTLNAGSQILGGGQTELSGTVTMNGNVTATNLALVDGTYLGTSTLHGAASWNRGVLGGTINVATDGTLSLIGDGDKGFQGGTVNVAGTLLFTSNSGAGGNGSISNLGGGAIAIQPGGLFDIRNNRSVVIPNGSTSDFLLNNAGTIRKTVATAHPSFGQVVALCLRIVA
jgi:hypothetical protein